MVDWVADVVLRWQMGCFLVLGWQMGLFVVLGAIY